MPTYALLLATAPEPRPPRGPVPAARVRVPARPGQRFFRPAWGTDLLYYLGQCLLWNALVFGLLAQGAGTLAAWTPSGVRAAFASQPGWLQVAEVVLASDVLVYWGHRLQHRVPFLWRFHAVHHSAEHLDWLAAHREHPLDTVYTVGLINLPGFLLGLPLGTLAGLVAFRGVWAIYIHSNVRLPLGPFRVLVGSPELHHWHHDKVPRRGQLREPLPADGRALRHLPLPRARARGLRAARAVPEELPGPAPPSVPAGEPRAASPDRVSADREETPGALPCVARPSVVVGLTLVACGDDAPGKGAVPGAPPTSPFDLAKSGKPLTPEELAQAMRMGKDGEKAAKELTDALKARLGPTLEEDAKKAKAFAERPLTAADVETYLALAPQMRTAAGTQGAAAALLAGTGAHRHGVGRAVGADHGPPHGPARPRRQASTRRRRRTSRPSARSPTASPPRTANRKSLRLLVSPWSRRRRRRGDGVEDGCRARFAHGSPETKRPGRPRGSAGPRRVRGDRGRGATSSRRPRGRPASRRPPSSPSRPPARCRARPSRPGRPARP